MSEESTNPKDRLGRAKPSPHLIPAAAIIQEAVVMGLGAKKYGPYNWRDKTVAASVYVSAAYRHLQQWFDGENLDTESGASHLAHARACLGIILDAEAQGKLVDDRPVAGAASKLIAQFTTSTGTKSETLNREPASGTPFIDYGIGLNTRAPVAERSKPSIGGDTVFKDRVQTGTYDPNVSRKPKVYIAGPMRGYEKFNFPAFDAARDRFAAEGWDVVSPADLDRQSGVHEDSVVEQNPASFRVFAERDTKALLSFRGEDGDAIAMLSGWEKSTGAVAEFFLARWLGLKVLNALNGSLLVSANVGDLGRSVANFLNNQ